MKTLHPLAFDDLLHYEIFANPIVPYISNEWLQRHVAKLLAKRTHRKYKRYISAIQMREKLINEGKLI